MIACNCWQEINERISEMLGKQGELVNYVMFPGKTHSTFKYKDGKRNKEMMVLHSYCPFCGKEYE